MCRKIQPFKMVLPLAEFKLLLVTKYLIFPSAFTWLGAPGNPQVLHTCQRSQENRLCRNRKWMRLNLETQTHSCLWESSAEENPLAYSTQLLPCSFKPNLTNQTSYFHPLLLFAKSDAAERISGRAWPGAEELHQLLSWSTAVQERICVWSFHWIRSNST